MTVLPLIAFWLSQIVRSTLVELLSTRLPHVTATRRAVWKLRLPRRSGRRTSASVRTDFSREAAHVSQTARRARGPLDTGRHFGGTRPSRHGAGRRLLERRGLGLAER